MFQVLYDPHAPLVMGIEAEIAARRSLPAGMRGIVPLIRRHRKAPRRQTPLYVEADPDAGACCVD